MAEAMAASSGGIDWTIVLKPFLCAPYKTGNKTELLDLCLGIVKR